MFEESNNHFMKDTVLIDIKKLPQIDKSTNCTPYLNVARQYGHNVNGLDTLDIQNLDD